MLQANVLKMRKPRLVIHNILEDTSITNLEETIMTQNPDIGRKKVTLKLNSSTRQRIRAET